jgi:hypothetical protein
VIKGGGVRGYNSQGLVSNELGWLALIYGYGMLSVVLLDVFFFLRIDALGISVVLISDYFSRLLPLFSSN